MGGNKLNTLSDDILESIFANLAQIPKLKTLYIGANDFSHLQNQSLYYKNVKHLQLMNNGLTTITDFIDHGETEHLDHMKTNNITAEILDGIVKFEIFGCK